MELDFVKDLFVEELREQFAAETALASAFPAFLANVQDAEIGDAIKDHLNDTKRHITQLLSVAGILRFSVNNSECMVMKGLIEAINQKPEIQDSGPDLAIVAGLHCIGHFLIARYQTLATFSEFLGYDEITNVLTMISNDKAIAVETFTEIVTYSADDIPGPLEAEDAEVAGTHFINTRSGYL